MRSMMSMGIWPMANSDTNPRDETSAAPSVPPVDPLIGSMLSDRYLVQRELGAGGFATVYLATDQKLMGRPVVVKVLRERRTDNEWRMKRFVKEVEALASIDHPSVIGILDFGVTPGQLCY